MPKKLIHIVMLAMLMLTQVGSAVVPVADNGGQTSLNMTVRRQNPIHPHTRTMRADKRQLAKTQLSLTRNRQVQQ